MPHLTSPSHCSFFSHHIFTYSPLALFRLPNTFKTLDDSTARSSRTRWPRTPRTKATIRIRNTTVLAEADGRMGRDDSIRINADCDPSEEAVGDAVTEVDVVEHGIRGSGGLGEDSVVGIKQKLLCVGGVGLDGFSVVYEFLVKVELADVRDVAAGEGLVLCVDGRINVGKHCVVVSWDSGWSAIVTLTVDVRGTSGVVAWECRVELQDTVLIGELDTTEHGIVDVARISRVAVAVGNYTTVHAGTVAVPGFESNPGDRLASCGVDDLDIECQGHARVAISDVLTDIFARDPCMGCELWERRCFGGTTYSMGLQ